MMQMVIETYCAEIEGLKQKLEERDRKIAKLEYVNEKLHTLTDLQEANVNIMHENTMKLRKEIERLTKESDEMFDRHAKENQAASILIEKRDNEIAELQKQVEKLDLANYELEKSIADLKIEHKKQVDELETTNGQAMAYIEGLEYELKQAVKDTANKIYQELCIYKNWCKMKDAILWGNESAELKCLISKIAGVEVE